MHVYAVCVCVLGNQRETRKKATTKTKIPVVLFPFFLTLLSELPQPTDVPMLLKSYCLLKVQRSFPRYGDKYVNNTSITQCLKCFSSLF